MSRKNDMSQVFIDEATRYLVEEYVPKIRKCVELLDDDEIWWRPNEHSNSVGNLILHLSGNIRQYVVSGIGGEEDMRQRDQEFAADGGVGGAELMQRLEATVDRVRRVLQEVDPGTLAETRTIQGRPMTVFGAIFHAVEHFSGHTGQIIHITKELKDRDLDFYGFEGGSVQHRWERLPDA